MRPRLRKYLFETLYKNRYLYRFASTVPFAGQWRIWQRLVLARVHGHDVLELGCGLGDLLADMLQAGYNCRAVEHSPQMAAAARGTLKRRKVGLDACIIQGSAQRLPFADATFDTVVSTFPSEYIYDPNTIGEIQRVLRPGGRVIVIEGANLLPVGYIQPLLVLIQILVYGPRALFSLHRRNDPNNISHNVGESSTSQSEPYTQSNQESNLSVVTEELPDAWFGRLIPLERSGLRRRSEHVRSRRWEVYITIGEKV